MIIDKQSTLNDIFMNKTQIKGLVADAKSIANGHRKPFDNI